MTPRRHMEPRRFHDDVTRSVKALTLGMVRAVDKRDARFRELGLRETLEMFQVVVAGQGGMESEWVSLSVEFDYHFYYSPGTHDSELEVPNFMYGAEISAPVFIDAHVTSWKRDPDNDAVTGANVIIGAVAPGVTEPVEFAGKVHLTFAGWASLFEDETELSE